MAYYIKEMCFPFTEAAREQGFHKITGSLNKEGKGALVYYFKTCHVHALMHSGL